MITAQKFVDFTINKVLDLPKPLKLSKSIAQTPIKKLTIAQIEKHISDKCGVRTDEVVELILLRRCRECGCVNDDCRGCIERTGKPCHWVDDDLCSACV